ncbi:hypothetical protein [Amycolatopsis thermoflava]|uniref:hypothetical protein n=1 Tax=Amycolatopsis thermoflava TaxID=84480 RepID=UPI003F49D7F1
MGKQRIAPGLELVSFSRDGVGSVERAWFGRANVYVKPNSPDHPFVVANELICSRLASMVGLPVPVGDVALDGAGERVWASALVLLQGQEPAPADPEMLLTGEPDLVAGTLVFDTWIGNNDRHDDNLIYESSIGLWLYDHDKTLGGRKTGDAAVLEEHRDEPLSYHVFDRAAALNRKHVAAWIHRIRNAPASAILRILQHGVALSLYSTGARDGIMDFLDHRRQRLPQLVNRSLRDEDGGEPVADVWTDEEEAT